MLYTFFHLFKTSYFKLHFLNSCRSHLFQRNKVRDHHESFLAHDHHFWVQIENLTFHRSWLQSLSDGQEFISIHLIVEMSQVQTWKTYKFQCQIFEPESGSIPIQMIGENLHHQTTHKKYKLLHFFPLYMKSYKVMSSSTCIEVPPHLPCFEGWWYNRIMSPIWVYFLRVWRRQLTTISKHDVIPKGQQIFAKQP